MTRTGVPKGWRELPATVWVSPGGQIVVEASPSDTWPDIDLSSEHPHNCDAMGCRGAHVVHRGDLEGSEPEPYEGPGTLDELGVLKPNPGDGWMMESIYRRGRERALAKRIAELEQRLAARDDQISMCCEEAFCGSCAGCLNLLAKVEQDKARG